MAAAPTLARPSPAMASSFTSTTSMKASKTWVLPPRPKPGRKSKKDLAAAATAAKVDDKDDDEEVEEAEKAINRTKQKASRERKQEYIAELEAKVRTYEQGDGERASFFQGLAKTYSEENAALKRENEELRQRIAAYESGQLPSGSSTPRNNAPSPSAQNPAPPLTRKASQDLAASTSANFGRGFKRQRTKSVSSNTSSSSTPHYANASNSGASGSGTSTISLASALSHSTAATSMTAVPYHAARSPAAIVIPSPTMSVGMSMHATPSPAASSSSYIPPSPPVSLGFSAGLSPRESHGNSLRSPHSSHKHAQHAGCGLCDASTGVSCICSDIGLREGSQRNSLELHEEEPNFEDLNLLPSASRMSEMDRCGFCTESTSGACLCAEAGLRKINTYTTSLPRSMSRSDRRENEDRLAPLPPSRIAIARTPSSASSASSGVPPGSTSVRLRLPKRGIAAGQIWRIDTSQASPQRPQQPMGQQEQRMAPVQQRHPAAAAGVALRRKLIKVGSRLPCSGDPRTCLACADDPAGQAFCSALSNSVCANGNCTNCPNRPSPLSNEVAAASATSPVNTRQSSPYTVPPPTTVDALSSSGASSSLSMPSIRRRDSSARDEIPHAMIPCSDAWATLREHPNIGYANLDMLASVVAKRTQCVMDEKTDKDGKIVEVEQQGVEEALDLLDHMRDVEVVKAKLDAIATPPEAKMDI